MGSTCSHWLAVKKAFTRYTSTGTPHRVPSHCTVGDTVPNTEPHMPSRRWFDTLILYNIGHTPQCQKDRPVNGRTSSLKRKLRICSPLLSIDSLCMPTRFLQSYVLPTCNVTDHQQSVRTVHQVCHICVLLVTLRPSCPRCNETRSEMAL